jgi:hypothetical protein
VTHSWTCVGISEFETSKSRYSVSIPCYLDYHGRFCTRGGTEVWTEFENGVPLLFHRFEAHLDTQRRNPQQVHKYITHAVWDHYKTEFPWFR